MHLTTKKGSVASVNNAHILILDFFKIAWVSTLTNQQREGGLRGSATKKEQKIKPCREVFGNVSKGEEDGR